MAVTDESESFLWIYDASPTVVHQQVAWFILAHPEFWPIGDAHFRLQDPYVLLGNYPLTDEQRQYARSAQPCPYLEILCSLFTRRQGDEWERTDRAYHVAYLTLKQTRDRLWKLYPSTQTPEWGGVIELVSDVVNYLRSVYPRQDPTILAELGLGVTQIAQEERAAEHYAIRRDGDSWTIVFAGKTTTISDTVGMRYIYHLVTRPGKPLSALELAQIARPAEGTLRGEPGEVAEGQLGEMGMHDTKWDEAGTLLDEEAKAAYRHRLKELAEERMHARARDDDVAEARIDDDEGWIQNQLKAAKGLGGRDRRFSSSSERARQRVSQAIRYTIKKLAREDHALAQHLQNAIKGGSDYSYSPDRPLPWQW